ncbi:MAG: hypothetical protein CMH11_00560 [Maritimibacter sp.]|nr:hypothetical protein [Maritimibacter sp.]|tara:strand:+ start:5462 stop:5644 length:183 start_codon:yes stop_codon:yes gene_type:complete
MTEGDSTDNEGTLMAFGADYKLADKSKGFLYVAQIEEEIGGGGTQEDTIYGIGFEHKFSM